MPAHNFFLPSPRQILGKNLDLLPKIFLEAH